MSQQDETPAGRASHETGKPASFGLRKGRWYVARSVVKWSRCGRRNRPLYEERLVLVDAASPRKALRLARKEAGNSGTGHKSLGVFELFHTDRPLGKGLEICRSSYTTGDKPERFVRRRFESGVWHSLKGKKAALNVAAAGDRLAFAEAVVPDGDSWPSDWYVVRSLYTTGPLGSGRHSRHQWVERFVLFLTADMNEANDLATGEAERFADATGLTVFPLWEAFRLFEDPGHLVELFSILRESKHGPRKFLARIGYRHPL